MSYQTTLHDYLAAGEIMGHTSEVSVEVVDNVCNVALTYSGCYSLKQVALIAAVGCCHALPESGTYVLNVEQTPNSVSCTYDWLGVPGSITKVNIGE